MREIRTSGSVGAQAGDRLGLPDIFLAFLSPASEVSKSCGGRFHFVLFLDVVVGSIQ